ncbi:MAG: Gfo/Idh/MocA family oxidoreductase [Rhodospirillales bacterium]|nr:Gfo/Idh/MocA family oxidoreductase [Rhodospirillales bacterium]
MSKPVNWGIISTAKIGRVHVVPAMMKSPDVFVSAIASRDLSAAQAYADELGIPKAYGSYAELLADPDVEAVYNPLPNHLHVPVTIQAMEAGKHVLCEKPIALDAAEAEQLIDVSRRTGKIVEEAFMVRQSPQWLRVVELVKTGAIGELRAIQGMFSYFNDDPDNIRNMADIGGGGIYDIGCYLITTSRMVTEQEPDRLAAVIDRDPVMKTDRLTSAIMTFPNGVQATWMCSTQMALRQRMNFVGTKGRIEVEIPFNAPNDRPCRIFIDDGQDNFGTGIKTEEFPVNDQYTVQGELLSRAIRDGGPVTVSLENSIANMRVIDAVFRAGKTGQWVDV